VGLGRGGGVGLPGGPACARVKTSSSINSERHDITIFSRKAEKTVEGLAGKSGATLKVTYRAEGANRIATRIKVSEAKKY